MPETENRSLSSASLGSRDDLAAASLKCSTASATNVPEPQAGIQNVLIQRVGHHLAHHGPGQPVRGVVLAQMAAFVRRYDRLIQDRSDVVGRLLPVEPGDPAGEGLEHGEAADLRGPSEEVGLHDALQSRLVSEVAAVEEVGGVGLGQLVDVAAEGRLHHHANDGGQVGMADEQVVHLGGIGGYFAQGGREQILPQLPLDLDGVVAGVVPV